MYLEIEDADAYFVSRLFADTWDFADDQTKTQALTMATNRIEYLSFKGFKKDTAQELAFPRCYTTASLPYSVSALTDNPLMGIRQVMGLYCETDIPQCVLDACCEEALALLERGNSKRARLQREGVKSFSLGAMSETYSDEVGYSKLLAQEAMRLLRPYLATSVAIV